MGTRCGCLQPWINSHGAEGGNMANAAKQGRGLQGRCWRGCSLDQVGIDQTAPWAHACTTPRARGRGGVLRGISARGGAG
jgi:hypothetical protein